MTIIDIRENCLALLHMKFITKCSGGVHEDEDKYYDEIVEFSPTSGEWTVLDIMMEALGRGNHAVSVIKAENVIQFCS